MKTVLEEQDEVLGQMEKDLASKEEELGEVHAQVEKLLLDNKNVEKLTKENENFDEQCERYKIKVRETLGQFFRQIFRSKTFEINSR